MSGISGACIFRLKTRTAKELFPPPQHPKQRTKTFLKGNTKKGYSLIIVMFGCYISASSSWSMAGVIKHKMQKPFQTSPENMFLTTIPNRTNQIFSCDEWPLFTVCFKTLSFSCAKILVCSPHTVLLAIVSFLSLSLSLSLSRHGTKCRFYHTWILVVFVGHPSCPINSKRSFLWEMFLQGIFQTPQGRPAPPARSLWVRPKAAKCFWGSFFWVKIFMTPIFWIPHNPPTPFGWVPAGPPGS